MPASLRGSRGSNTNNAAASDVPAGTLTAATRSWGWMAAAGLARSAADAASPRGRFTQLRHASPRGRSPRLARSSGRMAAAGLARSASCERVRMGAQFGWRGKVSRRLQVRSVLMKAVWSLPGRWPMPNAVSSTGAA